MPATGKAVDFAKRHPEFSFGVHLTYVRENDRTPECPILPAAELPGLVDENGRFLPSNALRKRALLGRVPVDQIERETTAQIESLRAQGISISHVDSHGHLHKFAPFRKALIRALPRFGICRVRGVQDVYLSKPFKSPTYWLGPIWSKLLRREFTAPTHLFMPNSLRNPGWPAALLTRCAGPTMEIGMHPGYQESWRNLDRTTAQEFAMRARAAGHELIGWKDI
jgi:predicted glycoside hydrolase/deacetylase ChbG (UPF0249 family)